MEVQVAGPRRVGFVGVGHMGKLMAASLLRAGHHLTVFDVRPEARQEEVLAGAAWAETARAAAEASDAVITMLPGPDQVRAAVLGSDGVLAGLRRGGHYIDMSTSTPACIREIGAAAAERGVEVLDAPVAGGVRGARHGTLTIMAGGSQAAFDACLPILRGMGEKIFRVGDLGAGHVAKLVNNMMTIVNALTAMEAMVVGAKAGVDPAKLLEVVEAGSGASYSLNVFPYVIFKRSFDPPKFGLSLAAKDLRIAAGFAEELGVPLTIVPCASDALAAAMAKGLADRDWTSYITLLENAAGVQVRPGA